MEVGIQVLLFYVVYQYWVVVVQVGVLYVVLFEQVEGGLVGEEDGLMVIDYEDVGVYVLQD